MIDFHAHILPGMDDGASSVSMSLAMLQRSFYQSVDAVVATSHFYADEEYPDSFLHRRQAAFDKLKDAMFLSAGVYPQIVLGAEVLYFPGISGAEDVAGLTIGNGSCILVEPPMVPWSDRMLDEIADMGCRFHCKPVIAHVDRFMSVLGDKNLINRVKERDMLVQVNGDCFLSPETRKLGLRNLQAGKIDLIGSDCHNMDTRMPNLGDAWQQAKRLGVQKEFAALTGNARCLLYGRK